MNYQTSIRKHITKFQQRIFEEILTTLMCFNISRLRSKSGAKNNIDQNFVFADADF